MKEGSDSQSNDIAPTGSNVISARLPCRGCRSDCKHYDICDGRPWRTLTPENTAVSEHPD
jgi:hypothetical protein